MSDQTTIYFTGETPVEISVGEFSGAFKERKGYRVHRNFAHYLLTNRDDFTADRDDFTADKPSTDEPIQEKPVKTPKAETPKAEEKTNGENKGEKVNV